MKRLLFGGCKLVWDMEDISIFINMWNENKSIKEIARVLHSNEIDIKLLASDQLNEEKIKPRIEREK